MATRRDPFSPEAFVANDRLGALLGLKFVSLSHDTCIYEYEAEEGHHNPGGTLHGGALFTAMDTSQGMLVFSRLTPPHSVAATGTATIKYLAPVHRGTIRIQSTLERWEGRKLFVHSEATDAAGTRVAVLDEIWITLQPAT